MLLDTERMTQVLENSGYCRASLAADMGIAEQTLAEILEGRIPASRRQAEALLNIFGLLEICWAMKDNWRWMPYAYEAAFAN